MALGMAGTESIDSQSWSCIHSWGDILESDESREHLHLHLAQYTRNDSQIVITYW